MKFSYRKKKNWCFVYLVLLSKQFHLSSIQHQQQHTICRQSKHMVLVSNILNYTILSVDANTLERTKDTIYYMRLQLIWLKTKLNCKFIFNNIFFYRYILIDLVTVSSTLLLFALYSIDIHFWFHKFLLVEVFNKCMESKLYVICPNSISHNSKRTVW